MESFVADAVPGVSGAEPQPLNEAAGAGEISLSALSEADEPEARTVEPQADADAQPLERTRDDGAQATVLDQQAFDTALGKRLARERERHERTPEYRLGSMLLAERMRADGLSAEEAYERILRERNERKAQEYADNPKSFYEDYLNDRQSGRRETVPGSEAERLAGEMAAAERAGLVPAGFDAKRDLDGGFVANLQRFGAEAALAIWSAARTASDQAEAQRHREAPRPMRVAGGEVSAPKLDFAAMSADEFRQLEARIEAAQRKGRRVTL